MGDAVTASQQHSSVAPEAALWTVHHGDARDTGHFLKSISSAAGTNGQPFLQTTITSPPYATLVDYGSDNQIGFGQLYEDYLQSCQTVFQAIHENTLSTGSMWIVADSMLDQRKVRGSASRLVPLPFELAAQAESVGWTLREVVIWRKDRTRPWSHRGKLRNGFEYVLLFVKSDNYIFNVDRLRDTGSLKSWWVKYPERHNPWGMTPDNVWEIPIPVQGSWDDSAVRHACPFPAELVRRMVVLSSNEGDVVFDPFAGSGAVVAGALREGRRGLGVELNAEYVSIFHRNPPQMSLKMESKVSAVSVMTQRLLELRILKYPKELSKQILRAGFTTSQVRAVLVLVKSVNYEPARTGYGEISCSVVVDRTLSEIECARLAKLLPEVLNRPPLSLYGLHARVDIASISEVCAEVAGVDLAIYTKGRTWYSEATIPGGKLEDWLDSSGTPIVVPVFSPLNVQQSLEESL